ncbi:hypothetical protein LP416_10575 [Polaromonas sp. P2-4]|nr:hypothetical protein LP416_10575 [Polaromonas sp. P2-4]
MRSPSSTYAVGGVVTCGLQTAHGAQTFTLGDVRATLAITAQVLHSLGWPTQAVIDARGATRHRGEMDPPDPATVVHHCGSGVSAVPINVAMKVAGLGRQPLYAGSWSEWCRDLSRPFALG